MKIRKLPLGEQNVIGDQIARLRLAKGIKQKDFISRLQAYGLDINPSSYSKIEGRTRRLTDSEIMAIAKVLSVPIQNLFPEDV